MSKEPDTAVKHSPFKKILHFEVHFMVWERKEITHDFTALGLLPIPPQKALQSWSACSMAKSCRAACVWSPGTVLLAQAGGQRCTQCAWLLPATASVAPDIIIPRFLRKCWGKALFLNVLDVAEEDEKENIHAFSLPQLPNNNFCSTGSNGQFLNVLSFTLGWFYNYL